ncbi:hypothetical protein [Legionella israelensis]|nr:hypothetical protein [Legionella israelensis]
MPDYKAWKYFDRAMTMNFLPGFIEPHETGYFSQQQKKRSIVF